MSYEIQQYAICDGWQNNWLIIHEDGTEEVEKFDTYQDARDALTEFLEETDMAYFNGDIESRYTEGEFRIVELLK